jgi:hypothetical protein
MQDAPTKAVPSRAEKRIKTIGSIKQLSRVAAFIHFVCLFIAFFLWVQNRNERNDVYEMYRPVFVPNSTLTTVVQNQLVQSCPRTALTVLTLQAECSMPESASILSTLALCDFWGFVYCAD